MIRSHTFMCIKKFVRTILLPLKRLVSKSGPHDKHIALIVPLTSSTILKYFPNKRFDSAKVFSGWFRVSVDFESEWNKNEIIVK